MPFAGGGIFVVDGLSIGDGLEAAAAELEVLGGFGAERENLFAGGLVEQGAEAIRA